MPISCILLDEIKAQHAKSVQIFIDFQTTSDGRIFHIEQRLLKAYYVYNLT